eukprot:1310224-Rhodomonas_salina.1
MSRMLWKKPLYRTLPASRIRVRTTSCGYVSPEATALDTPAATRYWTVVSSGLAVLPSGTGGAIARFSFSYSRNWIAPSLSPQYEGSSPR